MINQIKTSDSDDAERQGKVTSRTKAPRARRRTFYCVNYKAHARAVGMKFLNKAEVFSSGPPIIFAPPGLHERGFRSYPVMPRFHLSKRFGRMPCDIEQDGPYWLVSDRAKQVLSEISPADFAFMALDTDVDPGQSPVKYWLCDIIKMADAVDLEKSQARTQKDSEGKEIIQITELTKLKFHEDLIKDHHVFRLLANFMTIICDDVFKDGLKNAGITGLSLQDLTPLRDNH